MTEAYDYRLRDKIRRYRRSEAPLGRDERPGSLHGSEPSFQLVVTRGCGLVVKTEYMRFHEAVLDVHKLYRNRDVVKHIQILAGGVVVYLHDAGELLQRRAYMHKEHWE